MEALRAPTEIPAEALGARPESAFKPVQAWALAGGILLVFQLYVWGKWIAGPYFTPVPSGPSVPLSEQPDRIANAKTRETTAFNQSENIPDHRVQRGGRLGLKPELGVVQSGKGKQNPARKPHHEGLIIAVGSARVQLHPQRSFAPGRRLLVDRKGRDQNRFQG